MKTGTAIALAVGVPVTIGVIAWALLANKIVDRVPDFSNGDLPMPPMPTPDPNDPFGSMVR